MSTSRVRSLGLILVLSACAGSSNPPPFVSPATPGPGVITTSVETTSGPTAMQVEVRSVEGVPAARVRAIFARAADPLKHCLEGNPGKIDLRVRAERGRLEIDFAPNASLDPTVRECALAALRTVDLVETGSNVGGSAVPPSNFTSLVTLSW